MQAIKTAYLGPTNVRGSRIKASAGAGSIFVSYDHALNLTKNHQAAAKAFAAKFKWAGDWVGGTIETKADSFMVWTCACDNDVELRFTP